MTATLRLAALMGAGAYGVHQLRYALWPVRGATLRAHEYLAPVGTVVVDMETSVVGNGRGT